MRLIKWTLAGASAYVVYRYTIGRRRSGGLIFRDAPGGEEDPLPARVRGRLR